MVAQLRRGDVVQVYRLHLLVPERWLTSQSRYDWLWDCVHEIEDTGATWIEVESGRKSTVMRERDDAIRDALDYIRGHANARLRRHLREVGRAAGRPQKYSTEQIEAARGVWFDASLVGDALDRALKVGKHPPRSQLVKQPPRGLGPRRGS